MRIAAALLLQGCSLANAVHVCDPERPVEQQANVLTEGDQALTSAHALALLPNGRLAAVFTSKPPSSPQPDGEPELRLSLLGGDASPVPVCDAPNEVALVSASMIHVTEAAIASSAVDGHASLVAFVGQRVAPSVSPPLVFGIFVTATGCQVAAPFQISTETPGLTSASAPAVARIADDTFAVTWTEMLGGATNPYPVIRARLVRHQVADVVQFLPTVLDTSGGPARLVAAGARQYLTASAATGDGHLAIAWFESGEKSAVTLAVYDDRLQALSAPRPIFETAETSKSFQESQPSLAMAFDGAQLLVAWSMHDTGGSKRVLGRFFAPDGRSLSSPEQPDGSAFRFGTTDLGDESQVALAALDEGGFVAAWSEIGAPSHDDGDGAGLRAAAFDASGARRFANRACDAGDFRLNGGVTGNQTLPSLVALPGGGLAAAWTDDGHQGLDRSGAGVRAVALSKGALFAVP
jgi:hypothetical protein